jgi:hypothetical protein
MLGPNKGGLRGLSSPFNLAPNESKNRLNLGASVYPSEMGNETVSRVVNYPSKYILRFQDTL